MMALRIKLLFLLILISSTIGFSQQFETKSGSIEFLSVATVESFTGTSNQLNGLVNLADSSLDFYIDLGTVTTGVKLRDEHMRENHLETEKFPFAEFSGKLIGFNSTISDSQKVMAKGTFTIHGVSKEIEVEGKVLFKPDSFGLTASWDVLLQDYNIARPKFLFLKLSDDQKVTLRAELKKKD
jgi:polyisoprenoid-binding protein YceI